MQNIMTTKGRTLIGVVSKVVDDGTESQKTQLNHIGKIRVRIPEFHGLKNKEDLPDNIKDKSGYWTSDDGLPWVPVCLPVGTVYSSLESLFKVDEMVYVTYTDDEYQSPIVIGTTGRYLDQGLDPEGGTVSTSDNGSTFVSGPKLDITGSPISFIKPIQGSYSVTSPYGPRWGRKHCGVDLGASLGTLVNASFDGVVIDVVSKYTDNTPNLNRSGYGNYITLQHAFKGKTFYTRYAHLYKVSVVVNQQVTQQDVIGQVGCTGCSSGPHLHFEILNGGVNPASTYSLNPEDYVKLR